MSPLYYLAYSTFWNLVHLFFLASISFKITTASNLPCGVPIGWDSPLARWLSTTVLFPHSGCCWIFLRDIQPFRNKQLLISTTAFSFSLQIAIKHSPSKASASLWASTHYHSAQNTAPCWLEIFLKWMILKFILLLLPIVSKPSLQSLVLLTLMGQKTVCQHLCLCG